MTLCSTLSVVLFLHFCSVAYPALIDRPFNRCSIQYIALPAHTAFLHLHFGKNLRIFQFCFSFPSSFKMLQGPPGWGGGNNGWVGPPPPFMGRQGPPQGRYDQGRYDQGRHESPQGRYDGGNWIPGGGPPSHGPRGFGVPPPSAGGMLRF
jgi:hypothetical protein